MSAKLSRLFILVNLFPLILLGQVNSFLSTNGLGQELNDLSFRFQALGNTSIAITDSFNVGANPANYSNFSLSGIETGLIHQQNLQQIGSAARLENATWMPNMRYTIPIKRGVVGMSFGMSAKHSSRYDFQDSSIVLNEERMVNRWRGGGELNEIYIGLGWQLMPNNEKTKLALGANLKYNYGRNEEYIFAYVLDRSVIDTISMLDYGHLSTSYITGSAIDLGASYSTMWEKGDTAFYFNGAMTFQPQYALNTVSNIFNETGFYHQSNNQISTLIDSRDGSIVVPYNIVSSDVDAAGEIIMPSTVKVGLSLAKRNTEKIMNFSEWMIAIEARMTEYSIMSINDENQNFADLYRVSGGIEYKPKSKGLRQPIAYRIGGFIEQNNFVNDGNVYYHIGGTLGAGFPLAKSKSSFRQNFSKINVALTLGRRDNLNIDHITETYVNAGLGLTISNKWFVRRKFK